MTDITELAQSMKAAAKKATPGPWALARDRKTVVSNQSHPIANLSDAMHRMLADGTTGQDAEFISLANPANILSLVEALEKAQQPVVPEEAYSDDCPELYPSQPDAWAAGWNACRAAMLQTGTLINEGTIQAGNYPVIPEGWTDNDKANAALMMLDRIETIDSVDDDRIDGIKRIVRELAAATTGIPIISDTWIPVSEQMPPSRHEVLVGCWWGEKPRWCCKWATYIPGHPDAQSSGWLIPGASWTPTHWMPLPAAPQEVK
ncbi:DUF551 domain-containing protein [Klebsiella pneumoniae]|nr:DUF551 domain-containing protein [Klebsiella pneumoniae]